MTKTGILGHTLVCDVGCDFVASNVILTIKKLGAKSGQVNISEQYVELSI